MSVLDRLFPGKEVRAALQSMNELEKAFSLDFWSHIGFGVIKDKLRATILQSGDGFSKDKRPIKTIVLVMAHNIAWDEIGIGTHIIFNRPMSTGDGLISLYDDLSILLEKAGVYTQEEATQAKTSLRDMLEDRFNIVDYKVPYKGG
jgi:hypothetical protein